jgi:diguanylate cyclase (GGDEF)-like protein
MQSAEISLVMIPGAVALLLFLVFWYLYEHSRASYFRAWQLGWGAYCLHYLLDAWMVFRQPSAGVFFVSSLLLVGMAVCILVSTRLTEETYRWRWYDGVMIGAGVGLAAWNFYAHPLGGQPLLETYRQSHFHLEVGLGLVLLFCSAKFYLRNYKRRSLGYTLLWISLAVWGVLMAFGQLQTPYMEAVGSFGHLIGPLPQMLLGIAMLMVLFENERRAVQENTLFFSTLGVDASQLPAPQELVPNLEAFLDRLLGVLHAPKVMLCISDPWRDVLPSVQRGFSAEFLRTFDEGAGAYICELTSRHRGFINFPDLSVTSEPLPALPGGGYLLFREMLHDEGVRALTAISVQTREHSFGVLLFPHTSARLFASSHVRLAIGMALQIGLTMESYVAAHEAHRRTKEYKLLTQIGQAVSSRLDQDEILRAVQKELGQLFDTSNFYVAFHDGDEIRFELEVENGQVLPKRSREMERGLTEHIIRTGQPLLIRSELEKVRETLAVTFVPPKPAKSFCGAPIQLGGRTVGAMAALNHEREFVFSTRDVELMQTAARQVSVAVENARLFAEEQRRAKHLAFLNHISQTAIGSEDAEHMLDEIVRELQKNFHFDHIGIGILDYVTKDIEIKAEAGSTAHARGRRIPLGVGILGRVARSGEKALVQSTAQGHLMGVLPESRAVLCIPITYGETLMGVLNIESAQENAFTPNDVLIMNTLADLLATALHNSFVFQKLQQQSITDGLTGIKTRRFFLEALSSEWKRASRSGRPFSVVLVDLDKFKEVNDSLGHLEGDLVLARVGRLLEQKCRQSNIVARYGGDEFIILMPETGIEQAQILAERLRLWLATDPMLNEHGISGSFGVASFPVHGFSAEDIIRVADAGMYVAKHAGGNRVSTAEPFTQDEEAAVKRQLISSFIEGFLQREHSGPEHVEELITTLQRICGVGEDCNETVLREAIESLARAAESRELHAAGHGDQVARVAQNIGQALGLPPDELAELAFVARVHDIGKLFLPEKILNKAGSLSEDEYYLVKLHAQVGGEVVATLPGSRRMRQAIEHHHEAFNGTGYPNGLRGEEIPLLARILAVADAYSNMTSERSFAPAKTAERALTELEELSGLRFDGMVVRLLIHQVRSEKTPSS